MNIFIETARYKFLLIIMILPSLLLESFRFEDEDHYEYEIRVLLKNI